MDRPFGASPPPPPPAGESPPSETSAKGKEIAEAGVPQANIVGWDYQSYVRHHDDADDAVPGSSSATMPTSSRPGGGSGEGSGFAATGHLVDPFGTGGSSSGSGIDPERASLGTMSHFSTGLSVDSDNDSAMGDMKTLMSTQSLESSIYDYVEEHGRTFHRYKQGKYWMPNDKIEQDRLDLQHAVFMHLLKGKLGLAPLVNPQRVLDLGTGTGIWAIEFATEYPAASVIGTDLSPIQPEYVPPNCHFEVDDAEDEWIFGHPFDYVHLRLMFHTFKSHVTVIQSAFDNLNPGGWMEWQDYYCVMHAVDNTLAGTALERWCRLYVEAGQRLGRDMLAPRKYKHWMEKAGFVNVTEKKLAIPGNAWPKGQDMKMMGMWQMTNFLDGLHAVTMTMFTKGLGMSPEEVEVFLVDVRKDIQNTGIHFYFLTYCVYGQKPLDADQEKMKIG